MSPRMNEQELLKRLSELPREVQPRRDPWPEISNRIERGRAGGKSASHGRRWLIPALAASAVLALAAGLLFESPWESAPVAPQSYANAGSGTERFGPDTMPGLLAVSELEYQAAFREFISVGDSRESLPSHTVEKIELGWADLLMTETALAAALEKNPNDPFLNDRMLALRARQLGFLKQLVSLDRNNRRLNI